MRYNKISKLPNLRTKQRYYNEEIEKLSRHLKSVSVLRSKRSLSTIREKRIQDKSPARPEIPASLAELEAARKSLISLVKQNAFECLTPEKIQEIRQTSLPKEYRDFIVKKKEDEKKKYLHKLMSRSPIDAAVYQIRSLSRSSKWKIESNAIASRIASEIRFKKLSK